MRKIVLDFDLTILAPLILTALVVLWKAVRKWFSSKADYRACVELLALPLESKEEIEETLERKRERQQEIRQSKDVLWFSSVALVVLCAAWLIPDSWKVLAGYFVWYVLSLAGPIAIIFAILAAWDYAMKPNLIKFVVCILAILMAAASTEHFYHQKINANHVICPNCSESDDN